MAGYWTTRAMGQSAGADSGTTQQDDNQVVILIRGNNAYGDPIFSYVKMTVSQIKAMHRHVEAGLQFLPSDFGTVIAAGKGSPSSELIAEMSTKYEMVDLPPIQVKPKRSMFQPRFWGYAGEEGDDAAGNPAT